MIDLDRDIARGRQAAQLLESEIFREMYEAEIAGTLGAIRQSRPTDTAGRETAYLYLRALDRIRERLNGVVDSGIMAQRQRELEGWH